MSLLELKARITGPDGSLRDRLTIARELDALLAREAAEQKTVARLVSQLDDWYSRWCSQPFKSTGQFFEEFREIIARFRGE